LAVTIDDWLFAAIYLQVIHQYNNQISSQVAVDNALYSASEDDLETVTCFFAFQETRDDPKKKQYPDVDLLVSKHPAQSALEKPRF
jgi:hypothetical protein